MFYEERMSRLTSYTAGRRTSHIGLENVSSRGDQKSRVSSSMAVDELQLTNSQTYINLPDSMSPGDYPYSPQQKASHTVPTFGGAFPTSFKLYPQG